MTAEQEKKFRAEAESFAHQAKTAGLNRADWKEEYENLCKFATQFEEQRDEARAQLRASQARVDELEKLLQAKDHYAWTRISGRTEL